MTESEAAADQKNKRLSSKIFRTVSVFTLLVVIALAAVLSIIYYLTYEQDAEQDLIAQAQDAAAQLNAASDANVVLTLEQQFSGEMRYTLIASDGEVLYDSYETAYELENHADRPEVKAAQEQGHSSTVRYSNTLQTDTVYAAVELEDGTIIRLAETRHSLLAFLSRVVLPVLAALVLAIVLVFVLSRVLTNRIMRPIDALDFSEPLENEIYEEMDPLLQRIDEQQELLRQQNKELAEAESLRRDFSSNVSHEMKTPLQVISGYAELMQNDLVAPEKRREVASLIYSEAQAMRRLIDDILIISKLDEIGEMKDGEQFDLHALALLAVERLESFAAAQGVQLEVQGTPAYICGNQTLATQMVYNLIENGIRYNHPDGLVTARVEVIEQQVVLRVTDTGFGIPENMQEKIFERFFRVDKSRSKETGGTGLGLAIVKHAAIYHQGTITVESKLDAGTTFTLRFPEASAC